MPRRILCLGLTALVVAGVVAVGPVTGRDEPKPLRGPASRPYPPTPVRDRAPAASFHEGFETDRPIWRQEDADVQVDLQVHDRSERARHDGTRSEHFRFKASGPGNLLFYSLPLPKIPLTDDLTASLWVRSNQVGPQLLGRVVLPADADPDTGQATFVLVPGGGYDSADNWQRLTLTDLRTSVERQARVLRHSSKRKVSIEGAYLERLVVNLYGGTGETEVFLDDLSISPVPDSAVLEATLEPNAGIVEPRTPQTAGVGATAAKVRIDGGRIKKDGRDWIPSILWAPKADLNVAYPFGFDVLAVDIDDQDTAREAVQLGFLLMPMLGASGGEPREIVATATNYPFKDSVAFWHLGRDLGGSTDPETRKVELERTRAIITGLREQPDAFPKLTTADVAGNFPQYALPGQHLDWIGVAGGFWGTNREIADTFQYLQQRRNLTALWNLRAPYRVWIDATPPPVSRTAIWGTDTPPEWGDPRIQPEQIRVAAYLSLMAGYRGLGFRADERLTTSPGRANLYEIGLLNAEVDLIQAIVAKGIEPILALSTYPPDPKPIIVYNANQTMGSMGNKQTLKAQTFPETKPHPSVRAASIPTEDGRGRLVLITDSAGGTQWQPPQAAINDLKVVIPGAPENAVAWEISLGGVRNIDRDRVPGGVRFSVPDFGVATMVLLTTDAEMVERLKAAVVRIRPRAVDLAIKQAKRQLIWVKEINDLLVKDDHKAKDADDLLVKAQDHIAAATDAQAREDYPLAFAEARRASRPLRLMMREHWEKSREFMAAKVRFSQEQEQKRLAETKDATKGADVPKTDTGRTAEPKKAKLPSQLVPPVGSPPMLAFNTLPQHYIWADWAADGTFGRNLLLSGKFDVAGPEALVESGWVDAGYHFDRVKALVLLEPDGADLWRSKKKDKEKAGGAARSATEKEKAAPSPDELPAVESAGKILRLSVRPLDPTGIDAVTAFLDQPAAAVQTPPVPVRATQFVRIRVLVKLPRALPPGGGGLIVRDSLGGETLEFRTTGAIRDWTEIVLLRRASADGDLTVTLGLAGFGDAYFDDLRIDRLEKIGTKKKPTTPGPDIAGARRTGRPATALPRRSSAVTPPRRSTR